MYHKFIIHQSTYQQKNYNPKSRLEGDTPRPTVHEECATRNAHEVRMQGVAVSMGGGKIMLSGRQRQGRGRKRSIEDEVVVVVGRSSSGREEVHAVHLPCTAPYSKR